MSISPDMGMFIHRNDVVIARRLLESAHRRVHHDPQGIFYITKVPAATRSGCRQSTACHGVYAA
jgi:hypothetical protein